MKLILELLTCLNTRKNRALRYAETAMTESQFRAFRGLFLDEFGRNGLEVDLERIVANYDKETGKVSGRPIHAGKEVPHD